MRPDRPNAAHSRLRRTPLAVRAVSGSEHLPGEAVGPTCRGDVTSEGHKLLPEEAEVLGDPWR